VRIGPGARWMTVAAALQPHGWALSSGDYGGVGVGGLATAGGVGWLVREHGLTIDHVRRVQLVTADGRVVHASPTEHPELFWAVRGAGANFGIVTEFEFEVDEVGQVGWAQLAFDASDTAGFLERWGAAVQAAPRDVTAFLLTGGRRPGQPRIAQGMILVDADDPETIVARLQPFAQVGPLADQRVELTTYATVMANVMPGEHAGRGEPVARSLLVREITPELAAATADFLDSGATHFFQIRALGGAVGDVAPDATAFAHRDAAFSFAAVGADDALLEAQWATLRRHGSGLYTSFETGTTPDRVDDAFPAETLARLRRLKREWDPDAVFRDNFAIAPAPSEG
jgi:FAD/FMN-containing dehydrogenase